MGWRAQRAPSRHGTPDDRSRRPAFVDASWRPDPAFADRVHANRREWIERRCRASYWGMFTYSAKPAPASPRHLNVECAACGHGYAVNPHQGGTLLRRHALGKHPNAWAWWTQRVRELEAEEASGRLLREDAGDDAEAREADDEGDKQRRINAGRRRTGGSSSHHPAASASEVDPAEDPISAFAEARSDPIGAPVRGSARRTDPEAPEDARLLEVAADAVGGRGEGRAGGGASDA